MKTLKLKKSLFVMIAVLAGVLCAGIAAFTLGASANVSAPSAQIVAYAAENEAQPFTGSAVDSSETEESAQTEESGVSWAPLAAGIGIGLAVLGGGIGMGVAIGKAAEGISRQPEADGKIRSTLMIGLVFLETVVIYALIVAFLLLFVV